MVEGELKGERLDNLDDLEEELKKEQFADGYKSGLQVGREAGVKEGKQSGAEEGANIGSEVGYYRGFLVTWLHLLQSGQAADAKLPKSLQTKLQETLQLIDEFPKTNETSSEEMLEKIRVKFKQSTSLLNIKSLA